MRIPIWLFVIFVIIATLFVAELLAFIFGALIESKRYNEQLKEYEEHVKEKGEE